MPCILLTGALLLRIACVVIDSAASGSLANAQARSGRFDVLLSGDTPDPDPNILIYNNIATSGILGVVRSVSRTAVPMR